jgi:hypothetical protein
MPPKWTTWAASVFKSTGLSMEQIKKIYDEEFLEGQTWMNGQYVVIQKDFPSGMTHLSIRRQDRRACRDWRDFQAIKNQLCGDEREAIELYPAESRVVDTANQFHLWVMPEGEKLQIGWSVRSVCGPDQMPIPGAVQRAFDAEDRMSGPVNMQAVAQIRDKVRLVAADPAYFGVLSTGEKCAVALVLDDPELCKWWGTMLDCVDRLEGDWIQAAIYVQRNGWNPE